MRVVTSEDDAAGTEANVALTAYGARGASDPIPLGYNDGDLFQSCNTDEFDVSVHDETGFLPSYSVFVQ